MRPKRVLIYAQHLSGVGHHVRAHALATALAHEHAVSFVDGGRPVPRPEPTREFASIRLPGLRRGAAGVEPVDASRSAVGVWREREERLRRAIPAIEPDVVLVEHFPFSKWELGAEIDSLVDAARRTNPRVKILSSVRDVCPRTRHEEGAPGEYAHRVLEVLNRDFDALLVHGDPTFTHLDEHFPAVEQIGVPVVYTGFVSESGGGRVAEGCATAANGREELGGAGYAIASCGGGAGSVEMISGVTRAWDRLSRRGATGGRTLVIFSGLFWSDEECKALVERTRGGPFLVRPFSTDFLAWMRGADFSISRAGYNTCVNILESRCRALLVPDDRMSDQQFRARRLSERGLAREVSATDDAELETKIAAALHGDPPVHELNLRGAERTRALVGAL